MRKVKLRGTEKSTLVAGAKQCNLLWLGYKCLQRKQSPLSFILVAIGADIMVRSGSFSFHLSLGRCNKWEF